MKKLSPGIHGILDYVTVVYFLIAPGLFALTPTVATISYLLGIIHLLLTLFTNFSMGVKKIIPLRMHGFIEITVGIALTVMPLLMGSELTFYDSMFFILTGVAILLVWMLSRYKPHVHTPETEEI